MSVNNSLYAIEGFVRVDKRGQFVLPKELRSKASIKAGDNLAILTYEKAEIFITILMKTENLKAVYSQNKA